MDPFAKIRQIKTRLDDWRDDQSRIARGCGCLALIALGLLCGGFAMGAIMGDYGGPPDGRFEDIRGKTRTLRIAFVGSIACVVVGSWLTGRRRS